MGAGKIKAPDPKGLGSELQESLQKAFNQFGSDFTEYSSYVPRKKRKDYLCAVQGHANTLAGLLDPSLKLSCNARLTQARPKGQKSLQSLLEVSGVDLRDFVGTLGTVGDAASEAVQRLKHETGGQPQNRSRINLIAHIVQAYEQKISRRAGVSYKNGEYYGPFVCFALACFDHFMPNHGVKAKDIAAAFKSWRRQQRPRMERTSRPKP